MALAADIVVIVAGQLAMFLEVLDDLLPARLGLEMPDNLAQHMEALGAVLNKHHLERMVTLTGYQDRHWSFRVLW